MKKIYFFIFSELSSNLQETLIDIEVSRCFQLVIRSIPASFFSATMILSFISYFTIFKLKLIITKFKFSKDLDTCCNILHNEIILILSSLDSTMHKMSYAVLLSVAVSCNIAYCVVYNAACSVNVCNVACNT